MQLRHRRPFQRARLRYDATFSLEALYCHEQGIPYSEFLARWTEADRAIVNAVVLEKSERCTMCGTAEWEWREDHFAYQPLFHTCRGCQLKDLMNDDDAPRPKGTTVRLVPKETAAKLMAAMDARTAADGPRRPQRPRRPGR